VLIVDDDPALSRMLGMLLSAEGFVVSIATDGKKALEVLDGESPDVIVLDLQMPVMDGREFYRAFKQRGYETPVVILSAYNAETARQELGANAALDKPFDPDELSSTVRSLVSGRSPT
jgi:DNA-binding response OmpR family regulator